MIDDILNYDGFTYLPGFLVASGVALLITLSSSS